MKLSFISDEFTQSLEEAINFAIEFHFQGIELRSVDDRSLQDFSFSEIRKWKKKLDIAGLQISNLSSSFFKCEFSDRDIEQEFVKLEKLCRIAEILNCQTIRGFSFFKNTDKSIDLEDIASAFNPATIILQKHKIKLLLEADPSVNTTNHHTLSNLLSLINNQDCYGAVYDPGNCLFDPLHEKPFPDGYNSVKRYLGHVHIKDALFVNGKPVCTAPGKGMTDIPSVIKKLKEDGYKGWLSLEPHYRKNSILTENQMRVPQGKDFSIGGLEAMTESTLALKKILDNLNVAIN